VLESNTQLIANIESWKDATKKQQLLDIKMLLDGAIAAMGKVGLMMNTPRSSLQAVLDVLPALKTPTVSTLSDENWLALNTILDESTVRTIIPRLKAAGATGIVEYPLNKIVN
jgi:ATP phosphoribosyltransferase